MTERELGWGGKGMCHVVQVCVKGCYVCESAVRGNVEPCLVRVEFLLKTDSGYPRDAEVT